MGLKSENDQIRSLSLLFSIVEKMHFYPLIHHNALLLRLWGYGYKWGSATVISFFFCCTILFRFLFLPLVVFFFLL